MIDFEVIWKYAILGLLQGFTEPIPISSSGHLLIAGHLFGLHFEGLGFAVLLNFASLLAVLWVYRKDLTALVTGVWGYLFTRDPKYMAEFRFALYLVVGTLPAVVFGLLFNDLISAQLEGIATIGVTLIVTGIALWLIRKLKGVKSDGDLGWKDAWIVGFAQALALIPGISRSGATVVAAMARGMKRDTALKFSFFLYIPVSVGSMVLEGPSLFSSPDLTTLAVPYAVAFAFTLVATVYSLRWFMGIMARGNLAYFTIYCLLAGISVLLFL